MKFREEENLKPMIVRSFDPEALEIRLEEISKKYDFVDLQYAAFISPSGVPEYSALALVREIV